VKLHTIGLLNAAGIYPCPLEAILYGLRRGKADLPRPVHLFGMIVELSDVLVCDLAVAQVWVRMLYLGIAS
jgi:hypothetical protein